MHTIFSRNPNYILFQSNYMVSRLSPIFGASNPSLIIIFASTHLKMNNTSISKLLAATLSFCILLVTLTCCTSNADKTPDVSNIKIYLQTYRFDKDFSSIDTNNIGQGLQKLHEKYPDFLDKYLDTFFNFNLHGRYTDTTIAVRDSIDSLRPWLAYKDFVNLENTIKESYPDSKETDEQLSQGFKYLKYYFPNHFIPKILYINTYLSVSRWPIFPLDSSTICIGLDWFLGDQFKYYASLGVPPYQAAHMRKSYLPVSVFNTVYQMMQPFATTDKTLLDLMIQRGKEQYFLHKILPHTADSVIFGYAQHKLDWCAQNEGLIYNYFIHEGLLYNKQPGNIMPYIYDGPFAVNMPVADAPYNTPGNIGTWLGYKIVCAYMSQNPTVTLPQLIEPCADAARFIDDAKYRPK